MALLHRSVVHQHAARAARRHHPVARTLALGLFVALGYASLTGAAVGPSSGPLGELGLVVPPPDQASIHYSGTDAIITGSVGNLFETGSFSGPNRAEKTDRYKPQIDVASFSQGFEAARLQLASLRSGPSDPTLPGQSHVADSGKLPNPEGEGPRMSVAAIDPSAIGALNAIDALAPQGNAPTPMRPSEQLAYARAIAPVTGDYATGNAVVVSDKELWCLATAIYFEARGESYRGQVAVAQVVMNRTKHRLYPSTICGVVFQNQSQRNACQFSFACDGIPEVVTDRTAWKQAQDIAVKVTDGELYLTEVEDATHYHATYVSPDWAPRMHKITQIGMHVFYRFKRGWLFG
ncbi:cell wall hydrolase [Devosia sp.]|uniref:cell wall hydrolase n=1 Tax=Devosia sp. TaxID=1871048 RepID=UPI003264ECA0